MYYNTKSHSAAQHVGLKVNFLKLRRLDTTKGECTPFDNFTNQLLFITYIMVLYRGTCPYEKCSSQWLVYVTARMWAMGDSHPVI